MTLISALGSLYGAAPQLEPVQARAMALASQLDDKAQFFSIQWIVWRYYHIRGDLSKARALAEGLVTQSMAAGDQAWIIEAHFGLGATLFALGQLVAARHHLS